MLVFVGVAGSLAASFVMKKSRVQIEEEKVMDEIRDVENELKARIRLQIG